MNEYTILDECGVAENYDEWNDFQNRYNSRQYKPKRKPPVKLVRSVIREFEKFCKDYHIDSTKYKFIEPCEIDGEWRQFDFMDSEDGRDAKIQVHSIISDNNGKIYQRVIDL